MLQKNCRKSRIDPSTLLIENKSPSKSGLLTRFNPANRAIKTSTLTLYTIAPSYYDLKIYTILPVIIAH